MAKTWQRHSLTWGKRLGIVVLIMGAIMWGVLSLAQRSPEALRKGLEDYLTKSTGHRGEITDLAEARLLPTVVFTMRGINIRDYKNPDKIYVHADSAHISTPFWRMMFGAGGFRAMEIKGLEVATGYGLPQKLTVDFAGISDPAPDTAPPHFLFEGTYNALPLLATMEMDRQTGKDIIYTQSSKAFTTFKLGESEGEGILERHLTSVSLEAARIERGGMAAEFTAQDVHKSPPDSRIKGNVDGAPFNAVLTGTGENMLLKITPESSDPAGLATIRRFVDLVMGDLGLLGDDAPLRVEIAGMTKAPPVETTTDTPKDPE